MDIKEMKHKCHNIFDSYWKSQLKCNDKKHIRKTKKKAYYRLKQEIHTYSGHFHDMNDIETLNKAYNIVKSWEI
jgi:hypothetical protein